MGEIKFRGLRREDFATLARWLSDPLVARWWNHETSPEALERDFGPSIDGRDGTEMSIAFDALGAFGLIQRYPVAAWSEYLGELSAVCVVPPGALSIDYLIGEPDRRGSGLGARMIASFVTDSWSACPEASDVIVPVAAGNGASWRSLEKAGFRRVAEGELKPDNPIDPRQHYVYALGR